MDTCFYMPSQAQFVGTIGTEPHVDKLPFNQRLQILLSVAIGAWAFGGAVGYGIYLAIAG